MENNAISCLCLTYGRTHLIIEALHSYLIQKYDGKSEFLIINDAPFQKLHFEHPNVRIINLDKTFPKWGEKEDYGIQQCAHNIVVQWDDDDIAIRDCHLSNINDLYNQYKFALVHWNKGVFMNAGKIAAIRSLGNSGICFTKEAWKEIGGYPHENCGADMRFVQAIEKTKLKVVRATPEDDKVSWAYRWGENNYNCSGLGDDSKRPEEEQIISRHTKYIESEIEKGKIPTGDIELKPHWNQDYSQLLKNYISK